MATKNYYDVLGVTKEASDSDIKKAYRKLAKECHPDLHPGDEKAAERFKDINEAYETLSDSKKRSDYDYQQANPGFGSDPFAGFGGFGGNPFSGFGGFGSDWQDIFNSFSSRHKTTTKGTDVNVEINLTFEEAAKGCTRSVKYDKKDKCKTCDGTGAKNKTDVKSCPICDGTGTIRTTVSTPFGRTTRVEICSSCKGTGKIIKNRCSVCGGTGHTNTTEYVDVTIPAGADYNSYIVKKGLGNASPGGGENGDLVIRFSIDKHPLLTRDRFNLHVQVPITYKQAIEGGTIKVPTLDGVIDYEIPEGTISGATYCL